jgi:CheY-like chemotaxis protein
MSQVPGGGKNCPLVLVVERNMIVWPLMRNFLVEAGYAVQFAQDGREALILARASSPAVAVVLTDFFVPNVDGKELCRSLKADERTRSILVLVASHLADELEAKAAGADAFLRRPLDVDRLLKALKDLLERKERIP